MGRPVKPFQLSAADEAALVALTTKGHHPVWRVTRGVLRLAVGRSGYSVAAELGLHVPTAEKIVLVQDNLNTHSDAASYQRLPPAQARALAARFEMHYIPKNAS